MAKPEEIVTYLEEIIGTFIVKEANSVRFGQHNGSFVGLSEHISQCKIRFATSFSEKEAIPCMTYRGRDQDSSTLILFLSAYLYPNKFEQERILYEGDYNYICFDIMHWGQTNSPLSFAHQIQLATIFDNSAKLMQLFELHIGTNPNIGIDELIAQHDLFVLAAAHGAIKVINYFISMKISLEQRSLFPEPGSSKKIELTPLAAAVYFISKHGHEKATTLITTLLHAGANYNFKVVSTWNEKRGYAGSETIERHQKTSLFNLDKSGLFNNLINAYRNEKNLIKKKEHNFSASTFNNISGEPQDRIENLEHEKKFLKSEVKRLSHDILILQHQMDQLQKHFNIELKAPDLTTEKDKYNNSQKPYFDRKKEYRGRGRGTHGGFYSHNHEKRNEIDKINSSASTYEQNKLS